MGQQGTQIVLEAQNLQVAYGAKMVLKGVSLAIPENEITAVIGPSGCGKSTLLKSFNRLNEVEGADTTGNVLLRDKNIYAPGVQLEQLRTRVGMVLQNASPFGMSIYNNVSYGPRLAGGRSRAQMDELVESALRVVGLWEDVRDRLHQDAGPLTAGEKKRLCIAQVLANQPEVLLLDEPTSNLGPGGAMLVEELLRQLALNRITVVLTTHDMQLAVRLSAWCAFLMEGELVEFGRTIDMFSAPAEKRTEKFISGRYI